jgi:hypothetical protein
VNLNPFKAGFALESGDPGVPFNEKIEGRKSHDTVPLMLPELGNHVLTTFVGRWISEIRGEFKFKRDYGNKTRMVIVGEKFVS